MKHRHLLKEPFIWFVTVALASTMSVGLAAPFALAQGESASSTFSVPKDGATSIVVKTAPTKTTYVEGESFDPTGLVLTVTSADGTTDDVNYNVDTASFFSFDKTALAVADKSVTITFGGGSVALAITVAPAAVIGLAVKTAPTKTTYVEGGSFDPTGLVLTVTYENGVTKDIAYGTDTASSFSFDKTTLATTDKSVTITFGGKTIEQAITVAPTAVSSLVVKAAPSKISYIAGDTFVADGLILAATYENGTTKDIAYSPTAGISFDKSTLSYGDTAVAISFGGKTVSLPITVAAPAKKETVSTDTATYEVKSTDGSTGTVAYTGANDAAAPYSQQGSSQVQTRTFTTDGVKVTAMLTGSGKSIEDLVVEKHASASDIITSALGGRTMQSSWGVYFSDGTTDGFGTLTLTFPAAGDIVQVWEVHDGGLSKDGDQAVANGTASVNTTTLSEFAVTSAPDAAAAIPSTGDGSGGALPILLIVAAGAVLAALAARRRHRTGSRG